MALRGSIAGSGGCGASRRAEGCTADAPAPAVRRWAALLVLLAAVLPGAAAQTPLRDDRGAALRFDAPPQRIDSQLPSLTEAVCALGACARLVGTDRFSNWPAAVRALPKLGGLEDAQIERIVALRPDVVLAAPSSRVTERLEGLGLRVVVVESNSQADVRRTVALLARMLGTPAEGERLWQAIEGDLRRAAARVPPSLRGQRVYFEVSAAPHAAGAASFIGETLARLGMGTVVPAALGPFPKLNPDYVVRAAPDIVMATRREVDAMPSRPGWQTLRALQGRSCGFEPERYELLVRPGPRLGEAALAIADCLAGLDVAGAAR